MINIYYLMNLHNNKYYKIIIIIIKIIILYVSNTII